MTEPHGSRFPDALVLIFGLILLAQLATYILPAGEFEREGRQVIRGTYHAVEAAPLPPFTFLTAVPAGLADAADIIFFILIVGGVFGVLRATGAIDALIGLAIDRLGHRPVLLVGGMVTLFAVGSSTVGMAEEYMPFVPLLVTMCLALGLDAVVALGIIYVGAGVGYACAALNPFTVLIGQSIAGLELTSGQGVRWLLLAVCLVVGVHHILRYMRRVRADPDRSLVHDVSYTAGFDLPADVRVTPARMVVVAVFVAGVGLFVYGVGAREWYLTELTAVFLGIAILAAIVARLSPNRVARAFYAGTADLTTTAIIVGFARTIQVVLTEGQVIDTVIYALATPLQAFPGHVAALGMHRRPDGLQSVHPVRLQPGLRDDADHGAIGRPDRHHAADRGAGLSVRRRLHQHGGADQRAADGDAGAGPDPVSALAAVRRSAAGQALPGGESGADSRGPVRVLAGC